MNMNLRQERMRLLALAPETCLDAALSGIILPGYRIVRGPETGLVMARGRVGNTGDVFNIGEVLVTRCAVQLEDETLGHAWIMGESPRHAELAALCGEVTKAQVQQVAGSVRLDTVYFLKESKKGGGENAL